MLLLFTISKNITIREGGGFGYKREKKNRSH
jgi:hypothetical protein